MTLAGTVHVRSMTDLRHQTYLPRLADDDTRPHVAADTVRDHLLDLLAAGVSRATLSRLTGVSPQDIAAVAAPDRLGRPRLRLVDAQIAERLLLVHRDPAALPAHTRVLALGTQRRLQAFAVLGWRAGEVAQWLGTTAETVEALTASSTKAVTAGAHVAVARVFTERWATVPQLPDQDTVEHARLAGWQSPLAWDDMDFDLSPVGQARVYAVGADEIDDVAVDLALHGTVVTLNRAERLKVVRLAHAQELSDNTIAALTGIPLTTVFKTRQELGLQPWFEPTREYQAA